MTALPQTPGLYYEPVQPARGTGPLARGDIAAFIGLTRRGPLFRPVRVDSLRDVVALFGEAPAFGHLIPALKGFFETGGLAAYVVRVADPATATAAAADLGGGWRAQASFNWSLIDPRGIAQTGGAISLAWAATVEDALRDEPRIADCGTWGDRLAVAIVRAPLALTSIQGAGDPRGETSVATSLAGLEPGSIVELTQGARVVVARISAIDPSRQRLRWNVPLADVGLDPLAPARLASVEFRVDVLLDGKLAERFTAMSPDPGHSRSPAAVLAGSRYVSLAAPAGADPTLPANWPDEAVHALAGGRDGVTTLDGAQYLAALDAIAQAEEVALVAAPDLVLVAGDSTPATAPAPVARDCCDLAPAPLGRLQGLVVDAETGAPVAAATVEATATAIHATTDAAGRFTLAPLPLALLTIRVTKPGYELAEPLLQSSELATATPARIELAPLAQPRPLSADAILLVQQAMATRAGRYRVAIVDPPAPDLKADALLTWRAKLGDSDRIAFFAPWIVTADGIAIPPSGHVCGALAAGEIADGIQRAPANLPLRYAAGVSLAIDDATQGLLNPAGVNAIRSFPGRGIRIWGSRTLSSDPEWRYVTARRVVDAIERTLEASLQWAVFEPNNAVTRQSIAFSITALLERLWRGGVLAGASPAEAFSVKCDAENNDDAATALGELIAEIRVAPANPFEFVLFRIARALDALSVVE